MDDKIKNAEESLQIIQGMIEDEKIRFNENGFVYLFWGWLAIFCAALQYVLMFSGVERNYYVWFLMLFGGVFMGFYFGNKKNSMKPMPLTGKVLSYTWIFVGLNVFAFAFLFPVTAGNLLMLFILSMIGVGTIISGALLRFHWLVAGGIVCNILAFFTIWAGEMYWGVISIVAILFADIIPGYILRAKYRKNYV